MDVANDFIFKYFAEIIEKAIKHEIILDFKTKLQEILQKNGEVEIRYELDKYEGPPHRRKFFTTVIIDNKVMGNGYGYSKKESEQCAAKEALRLLGE